MLKGGKHNAQIECIYTLHVPSKTRSLSKKKKSKTRIVISDKLLTSIAKKQTSVLLPQQQNQTITPTHFLFFFAFLRGAPTHLLTT